MLSLWLHIWCQIVNRPQATTLSWSRLKRSHDSHYATASIYEYEYEIFIALISQRNIRVQGSTSIKIYGYQHTTNKLNTKWKYKAMVQNHWIQCRTKMTMKWLVHIVAYTTGHSCNNPPGGHRTRRGRPCSKCQYKAPGNISKISRDYLTNVCGRPSLLSCPGQPSFSGVLISPIALKGSVKCSVLRSRSASCCYCVQENGIIIMILLYLLAI